MNVTVSLDSVWNLVQSLSSDNQKWLADKIYENIRHAPKRTSVMHPKRKNLYSRISRRI